MAARKWAWLVLAGFFWACIPLQGQDKTDFKGAGKDKKDVAKDKIPVQKGLALRCARENAVYKVGETVDFLIYPDADASGAFRFSADGFKTIREGKLTVKAGEVVKLSEKLAKPGFLQLSVTLNKQTKLAAAAFDPTQIEPTAQMPADFDAFWQAGLQELAKVPLDAKLEKVDKASNALVTCYKISLANVHGKRVHGWVSVPTGTGPFPAILTVPGAGVYGIGPDIYHARLGAISMNIIIHDIPVDESPDFYRKANATTLKGYRDVGMADRDKSYFRDVILGCVRCIDYLVSRDDFNGKDLAVTGGSQGGALTLIVSGLDPRVKLAAPNVAAMCDHSGFAHDRVGGWPHWLTRAKDAEAKKNVLATSAYFDAVNFARKFKGKSLHGVGFIDTVCAPTTVYAAFNVHPEPKVMIASPLMGHGTDPRFFQAREEFWKKNMALQAPGK